MEGALQTLLSGLTRPLAHVVHIGAGSGAELALYQAGGAASVTLIEADAETADRLETLAGAHEGVTVIRAVVSGDTRKRAFRQMNFPDLSSLRVPTGLKELFPGLRILSKELVTPVDPARLITPLDLPDTGANLLVIEAPGEALGILRALAPDDLLQRFDAIHLQEARAPLYDQAPAAEDIRAYLVGAGFTAVFETSPRDPERPYLSACLDRMALQQKRAYDALVVRLERARARNEELTGQLAAVRESTEAEITALRAGLAGAERQALEHAGQAEGLREDLAAARETAAQDMAALRAELTGVQAELTGVQQESRGGGGKRDPNNSTQRSKGWHTASEETGQELAALQGELAEARERAGQLDGQIEELTGARAALVQELAALRDELASARQESDARAQQVNGLRAAREEVALEMAALRGELAAAQKGSEQSREARAGAEHRLAQAREEMLKAEGQINLIRDLLLQGPVL